MNLDIDVSHCFSLLNIYPRNSSDMFNRTVFNAYTLDTHEYTHLYTNITCCSNYSFVSFHYMQPDRMLLLDYTIKKMNEQYRKGLISQPSYKDILKRYSLAEKVITAN